MITGFIYLNNKSTRIKIQITDRSCKTLQIILIDEQMAKILVSTKVPIIDNTNSHSRQIKLGCKKKKRSLKSLKE